MQQEVDVAIVGAGAAGIAAARRLMGRGRSVLLIEALDRLGGRAHTVEIEGDRLDLGCGWLHSGDRNPLAALAQADALPIVRGPVAWGAQLRDLGFPKADQRAAAAAYGRFAEQARAAPPPSDRAGDLIPRDDPWRAYADALSGYLNGAELDRLSVADFLAYDDAATDANWRLPDGYGTFIAGQGGPVLTALAATARSIDDTGARVTIATDRGTVSARAAVVTVSTCCLAAGTIRFSPALDDHLHAAAQLPLGLADKLFLRLADRDAVPPESHLLGDPHRAGTGSYYLWPFGRGVIECFFGGTGARALEGAGPGAAEAVAREELGGLLGADFARGLRPLVETAWGRAPTIRGSYSHALPGRAGARAVLATPPSPRLAFAGEACSPRDFSTAHGAWESGLRAAAHVDQALRGGG